MTDPAYPDNLADTIRDISMMAMGPRELPVGGLVGGLLPEGWHYAASSLEEFSPAPHRKRGNFRVEDVDSFLAYLDRQNALADPDSDSLPSIWLQPDSLRAVAVFDDHAGLTAGWRDHTATLTLKYTREWMAWAGIDRHLHTAAEFADFVDEWRHTISDPPTADLLDIVRNFRAVKKVTYGKEIREQTGDVSLEWSEDTTATAGKSGLLQIPEGFMLVMAPFEGAQPVKLPARFRYTVSDGTARFGVILDQPEQLVRSAFDAEVARIRDAAPFVVMVGMPDLTA